MALEIVQELFEKEKLSFEDIVHIIESGERFGIDMMSHAGLPVGVSEGVQYAILGNGITINDVKNALDRFLENDFGDFYERDENPIIGCEYGLYPSTYGKKMKDGALVVHRENETLVVYFQFER